MDEDLLLDKGEPAVQPLGLGGMATPRQSPFTIQSGEGKIEWTLMFLVLWPLRFST